MKKAIVVILVLLLLSVTGCSFSITTANISEPIMTTAIQNGEPIDEVVEYTQDAAELISVGILNNAPADTKITFIWNYLTEGQIFYEIELNSEGESGIYIFSTVTNDGLWPVGEYSVDMYIDDREKPDITVKFIIKENQ